MHAAIKAGGQKAGQEVVELVRGMIDAIKIMPGAALMELTVVGTLASFLHRQQDGAVIATPVVAGTRNRLDLQLRELLTVRMGLGQFPVLDLGREFKSPSSDHEGRTSDVPANQCMAGNPYKAKCRQCDAERVGVRRQAASPSCGWLVSDYILEMDERELIKRLGPPDEIVGRKDRASAWTEQRRRRSFC